MEDFDIEIIQENVSDQNDLQLPMNFLGIGEVEVDDAKIYIKQEVFKKLEEYAVSDTSNELGTILLGDFSESIGRVSVVISDFIYAKYTDASASTLTFTHETWDYVHKEHEEKYREKKIIGWQHTHPGYGIFLSNYDMFIQENFFNLPFQVAYVIDPIQHLRGFFQWKNGKVEKLNGYYIYDEVGERIRIERYVDSKKDEKESSSVKGGGLNNNEKKAFPIIPILSIAVIALLICTIYMGRYISEQKVQLIKMESRVSDQENEITNQVSEILGLKESIKNIEDINTDLNDRITQTQKKIEEQEKIEQKREIEQAKEEKEIELLDKVAGDGGDNLVSFRSYTVSKGDSIASICKEQGIDYNLNYHIIRSLNGLKNPSKIYPGQVILIPEGSN